jgi:hypothetical protein
LKGQPDKAPEVEKTVRDDIVHPTDSDTTAHDYDLSDLQEQ